MTPPVNTPPVSTALPPHVDEPTPCQLEPDGNSPQSSGSETSLLEPFANLESGKGWGVDNYVQSLHRQDCAWCKEATNRLEAERLTVAQIKYEAEMREQQLQSVAI